MSADPKSSAVSTMRSGSTKHVTIVLRMGTPAVLPPAIRNSNCPSGETHKASRAR